MSGTTGCMTGHRPGTTGLTPPSRQPRPTRSIETLVLDLWSMVDWIDRISYIWATANSLRINAYMHAPNVAVNTVTNVVDSLPLIERPPQMHYEVHIPPAHMRQRKAEEYAERLMGQFLALLASDPAALVAWGNKLEQEKWKNIAYIDQMQRDCAKANNMALDELTNSARKAAVVQVTASVVFTVLSAGASIAPMFGAASILGLTLGAGAPAFAASGCAFSITMNLIKDWNKGGHAEMVAIEVAKTAANDQGSAALVKAGQARTARIAHQEKLMARAQRGINDISRKLLFTYNNRAKAKVPGKPTKQLVTDQRNLLKQVQKYEQAEAKAKSLARQGKALRAGGVAVVVFFAAWDILGWRDTFNEQMQQIGP